VRAVDATCPFCGLRASNVAVERYVARSSRAAVFVGISLASVACGARTDLGTTTPSDAAAPDALPQCVAYLGACTETSQCCQSGPNDIQFICEQGVCIAPGVFYGGPFPQNDE
jgi:hypothetical protein